MTIRTKATIADGQSFTWSAKVECDGELDGKRCGQKVSLGGDLDPANGVLTDQVIERYLDAAGWSTDRGRHLCPPPR